MVVVGTSNAAVIYEGFDYEVGNLSGQDGGTGFAGAWAATKKNPQVDLDSKDWGSLPTTGNHARGGTWSAVIRPIGSTLADAGLMANGATLWFSVVFDLDGQNYTNADLNLALGTDQFISDVYGDRQNLDGATAEGIGTTHYRGTIQGVYWQDNDADNVAERTTENSTRTLSAANNDNRVLIVGRIEWGADNNAAETLTLYAPDTDLNLGTPILDSWTTAALDQSQFDSLALQFKDTPAMDEIRFGATYADVAPLVPEPATMALVGIGGLLAMRRRR